MAGIKEEASATATREEVKEETVAPASVKADGEKKPEASTTKDNGKDKEMPPLELNSKKEVPKRKGEVLKRPQDASAVVTRNGKTWNEMFDTLVAYKARVGDTMVPDRFKTDDGVCLGLWVRNQRRRKDSLTDEQQTRLTDLGLDWQTQNERFDNVWHDRYAKLTEYRVQNGDCRVPYTYKPDPALAKWVSQQRAQQAQGRLAEDRKSKLDEIDFSWKLNTVKNRNTKTEDKKWQRQYEKLVAFKQEHSHCKVPDRYKPDKPLGTWVKKQRLANACDQLKEDRKKLLDELGFVWRITDKTDGEKWDKMFQKLKDYKEANGTCHVSRTVPDSDLKPLARWVKTQRALYKSGKILPDRKDRLETINFVWDGTQLPVKRKRRRQSDEGETKAKADPKATKKAKTEPKEEAAAPPKKALAAKAAAKGAAASKAAVKKDEAPEAKVVDTAVIDNSKSADKKGKAAEKDSPAKATKAEEPATPGRRSKRAKMPVQSPKEEVADDKKGGRSRRGAKPGTFYV